MSWTPYLLDQEAQKLVLKYRDKKDVLGQSYKMRTTVAYGLERFWGEHLRLRREKDTAKAQYWKETWDAFEQIMKKAQVVIPNEPIPDNKDNTPAIEKMSARLWNLKLEEQRIALAVLTQLCDSLVWWTQRYKIKEKSSDG
ncbi:hypothetical protein [Gloeobacter morelensis]|uniref:CRISPR type III-B/RAMP module-associated protein Cmr5 n=1 Tax=Gloeobacter morelensis MG652769 TaxID=2781736 RepID=A0ABY3PIV8_9CYAN|nr:hypothetical protein [Gloeobacter morelensis]UFP93585.1 hypothetical protein ISF26_17605 [Gloeobacter morelensis MG652769]